MSIHKKEDVFENIRKIHKVLGYLSLTNMDNPLEVNRILGREFFPNMNNFIERVNTTMSDFKDIYEESNNNKEKLFYDSIRELKEELRKETDLFFDADKQFVRLHSLEYGRYSEDSDNTVTIRTIEIKFDTDTRYPNISDTINISAERRSQIFMDDKFIPSGNNMKYEERIKVTSLDTHEDYHTPIFENEDVIECIIDDDNIYKYITDSLIDGYNRMNENVDDYTRIHKNKIIDGFKLSHTWDKYIDKIDDERTYIVMGVQYWNPSGLNQAQYSLYDSENRIKEVNISEKTNAENSM